MTTDPQPAPYEEMPEAPYPSATAMAPHSMRVKCPSCQQQIHTVANPQPGLAAFISGTLLTLFGCILCAWIPCIMQECKDVTHTCPHCGSYLGKYKAYFD
ncbi:LITAF-like zinc ribbon domain-containing protein [Ditylenchus destructor]|uniref:LITAF-like zinc ribbon domain-containing protein n=1 Tax=Ditylenchus destructor TaxID=166010 RepID=A0AAD4N0J2_9BILA|nr:LITAF-like zinc ribbon domain-containing protein [Ditylenchus destructor]